MKKWILIVHADPDVLGRLVALFNQEEDFLCQGVPDGDEAINLLRTNPQHFNMVITAIRMPDEGDGLRLLAAIKADEALQHLPVLMTGSTFTSEEITEAGRLGAFAWSNRPFETGPFLFTIRRELARLGVRP